MRRIDDLTVFEGIDEVPSDFGPSVVTIGLFDGVHRGHRALMRRVLEHAAGSGAMPTVVTFDRHPAEVIAPGKAPKMLMSLPQRARAIADVGIRSMLVLRFDAALRAMPPEEFVRSILSSRLRAEHVVVGANFRFGYQQEGTIETLNDIGPGEGFGVTIFALVAEDGQTVSSTMIRGRIAAGEVEAAAEELGRPFTLEGFVESGAGRGRGLGFPTANLRVPERILLPKLGVYAGWFRWKGRAYPAVTNVGLNPTFGDRDTPIVEVHVLDFDADLYGQVVELEFTNRIRDEIAFTSPDALVEQIADDVVRARTLLGVPASGGA